jgi:hypothetical protein
MMLCVGQHDRWGHPAADDGHHVSLSAHVSAPQLGTHQLENAVKVAVGHLFTSSLVLEITESLALDQVAGRLWPNSTPSVSVPPWTTSKLDSSP